MGGNFYFKSAKLENGNKFAIVGSDEEVKE